jgi:hypothetical protein
MAKAEGAHDRTGEIKAKRIITIQQQFKVLVASVSIPRGIEIPVCWFSLTSPVD